MKREKITQLNYFHARSQKKEKKEILIQKIKIKTKIDLLKSWAKEKKKKKISCSWVCASLLEERGHSSPCQTVVVFLEVEVIPLLYLLLQLELGTNTLG